MCVLADCRAAQEGRAACLDRERAQRRDIHQPRRRLRRGDGVNIRPTPPLTTWQIADEIRLDRHRVLDLQGPTLTIGFETDEVQFIN